MEKWDKIKKWFYTHAGCVIAVMLIFLGWYIAFTCVGRAADIASWTSIILAVVVIIFMIIQHAIFDAKMEKIEDRLITDMPRIIEREHGRLKDEILRFGMNGIPGQAKAEGEPGKTDQVSFNKLEQMISEDLLCLYCFVKSQEVKKPFLAWLLFEQIDVALGWGRERRVFFLGGMFAIADVLMHLLPAKSISHSGTQIGETQFQLLQQIPNITTEAIKAEMGSRVTTDRAVDLLRRGVPVVDNYFAAVV